MNNAVIYARFSSDKQTENSIEAQVRACEDYAEIHGYTINKIYSDEAVSAKNDRRPEFQKMIKDAEKGLFQTVLVHKYNRFARRMIDHVTSEDKLNQAGVDLIAVAEDFGNGKEAVIMKALMRSLSEYYILDLSTEVKKGHKETALKGLHNGGYAPFGYDVVGQKYVVNEMEASYVRKMFEAARRQEGFTELIREMADRGITGKRGKPIKYPQIYEILRNEKYTGVYTYSPQEEKNRGDRRTKPNAIKIENALPIIIDKAQFMEVQAVMNTRKQTGKKAGYLCSGLVYCKCGAKMHGMKSKRKGHEYQYYYCSARCGAPVVHMEEVDTAAINYLRDLLSPDNQKRIADAMRNYKAGEEDRIKDFKAILNRKIREKQNEYDTILSNISKINWAPNDLEEFQRRMHDIKAQIEVLKATEPPKDYTVEQIKAWLESLKKQPDRDAVRLLIERIDVISDGEKEKAAFNIQSTLKAVLGEIGCGGSQHIFPEILFHYLFRL